MIAVGQGHSMFLDINGIIWVCGSNEYGQLGLGHTENITQTEKIQEIPTIQSVSSANFHSVFIDIDGYAWTCGKNESGQLGLGDFNNRSQPEKIQNLSKIQAVSAGYSHSLFLDVEGNVWVCGKNIYGQLGLGEDCSPRTLAEQITDIPKIQSIFAGFNHSLFLDVDGCVWACGNNGNGRLGLESSSSTATISYNKPEKIQNIPAIQSIAVGWVHSVFLDVDGNIWVCGNNEYGQLGLSDTSMSVSQPEMVQNISKIQSVYAAYYHSIFIDVDGHVWVCGCNKYGHLGFVSPSETTSESILLQKLDNLPFIQSISTLYHSIFLDVDGCVWACGKNTTEQLALGDAVDRKEPEKIANLPPIARKRTFRVKSARKVVPV